MQIYVLIVQHQFFVINIRFVFQSSSGSKVSL